MINYSILQVIAKLKTLNVGVLQTLYFILK